MRLGADPVKLHDGTRAREIYGEAVIYERHRHRYEVSLNLRRRLEKAGLVASRHLARRAPGRVHRAARPPVLRRLAVPPRVQVAPRAPGAAVPRVRARRHGARPRSARRRVSRHPAPCERRATGGRRLAAAHVPTDASSAPACTRCSRSCARSRRPFGHERRSPPPCAASWRRWAWPSRSTTSATCSRGSPRHAGDRSVLLCAHLDTVPQHLPDRARSRSTRAGRTPTTTSWAPTTRPPSPSCCWPPERAVRQPQPRRHRAAVHAAGGERPQRRRRVRRLRAALDVRLRLRPRHADRRDRAGRAELLPPDRALPRPRRPRRHPPAGRPLGHRRRGARGRRPAPRAAGRRDDRQRRHDRRRRGGHERRARVRELPGRGARHWTTPSWRRSSAR